MTSSQQPLAILYQAQAPPVINGNKKPLKQGGYADSGADIGFGLQQLQVPLVTPVPNPDPASDIQWVFPDTASGIQAALDAGARTLWLNTVLFKGHPIEGFAGRGICVVGQLTAAVDRFDDKWSTNELLRSQGLPVARAALTPLNGAGLSITFPLIVKPVRGRGSQGVQLVSDQQQLEAVLPAMEASYGKHVIVEEYLPGQEVTISVLPPGRYYMNGRDVVKEQHWALPPVRRFNHVNGVAPYNGVVAVVHNSEVLDNSELESPAMQQLCRQCAVAAALTGARGLVRIDCRAGVDGSYRLFDLNMKPNLTGAGRPGRDQQDSLTALAARKLGWSYPELLLNLLRQRWEI